MVHEPTRTSSLLFSGGASKSQNGGIDAALPESSGSPSIIAYLKRHGIPLTRDTYKDAMWDHAADGDDGWTAEHEDSLPRDLRR